MLPHAAQLRPTLVTGFGAFGGFDVNPSALLAAGSGRQHRVLEVAYAAADAFVEDLDPAAVGRVVMLGVAGRSQRVRLERRARNWRGPTPDVRGFAPEPGVIAAGAPDALPDSLFGTLIGQPSEDIEQSTHAGDYLCNYLFFRLRHRHPTLAAGFVHVAPLDAMPLDRQREALRRVLEAVEGMR